MLQLTPRTIPFDQIVPGRPWSLNQDLPAEPGADLIDSIKRFSILHPPILKPVKADKSPAPSYEIVCGARRIAALTRMAHGSQIPCLVIDAAADPNTLLTLVIEEQLRTSPLSPIQIARLAAIATSRAPDFDFTTLTQLKPLHSNRKREEYRTLLVLDESIRTAIHTNTCSMQTGLFLARQDTDDRQVVFEIITKLSLNGNKQRRLIEFCRIISSCRQSTISGIFATDFPELLSGSVDNVPQKSAQLMKTLHQASHPLSCRAEESFAQEVKDLGLPDSCRISHSPAFEQDTVTLEIDFPRLEDCRKFLESNGKRVLTQRDEG